MTQQSLASVECCPTLEPCTVCDVIEFPYRLPFRAVVQTADQQRVVPVEVTLRFRLERCSGPLSLGDLVYTNTLLPGEKVQLFTSDRHSRFTVDSESNLSYRNQTTSEESFYLSGMASSMSNLDIVDNSNRSQSFHDSTVSGGGGAGVDLGIISFGGSVSGSSHDARSTDAFAQQISQHADASSRHVESGVRAASSVQVGEVSTRSHTSVESQDHFESSSRTFSNPNHCRALTFLFYRINKCQTVRWTLVSIDRRVDDPAAPTGVRLNPAPTERKVAIIPDAVVATSKARPDTARRVNEALTLEQPTLLTPGFDRGSVLRSQLDSGLAPIPADARDAALAQVTAELREQGLLDENGQVSEQAHARFDWERELSLPTPGILVKSCLDTCDACEPEVERSIILDNDRKELENKLLARQIELLDKAQQYRCCPGGCDCSSDPDTDHDTDGPKP